MTFLLSWILTRSSTQWAQHVDSTSILRQYIEDQISTNFHVISTCSFWCNFADWKIHVVFTYFFPRNFDDRNIHILFKYFFWYNFDGQKIPFVSTHFFRCNFSGQKFALFARNIFDETSIKPRINHYYK